jgi:hypothetical protein
MHLCAHVGALRQNCRRGGVLDLLQALLKIDQELAGVSGTDLSGITDLTFRRIVADQQGPEADARPLRLGVPDNDEFLGVEAFDLQPVIATRPGVDRVPPL